MQTRVTFEMVGGNQPLLLLPVVFNGTETVLCALDTGASHAILLPETAARLGLEGGPTLDAQGAGGAITVQMAAARSVAVGDAVVTDVAIVISDEVRRVGDAIGRPLAGILGFSFLKHYRLTVDYERLELTLATPDEPGPEGAPRLAMPFTLASPDKPLIMVPVRADGRDLTFALDTGASTTVIAREAAERCGLVIGVTRELTGAGGKAPATRATIGVLEIEGVRLTEVKVAVVEFLASLSAAIGTVIDGIVGSNVLRQFRVTIDYPGSTLRFD